MTYCEPRAYDPDTHRVSTLSIHLKQFAGGEEAVVVIVGSSEFTASSIHRLFSGYSEKYHREWKGGREIRVLHPVQTLNGWSEKLDQIFGASKSVVFLEPDSRLLPVLLQARCQRLILRGHTHNQVIAYLADKTLPHEWIWRNPILFNEWRTSPYKDYTAWLRKAWFRDDESIVDKACALDTAPDRWQLLLWRLATNDKQNVIAGLTKCATATTFSLLTAFGEKCPDPKDQAIDLRRANLCGADLRGLDLSNCFLQETNIRGAQVENTLFPGNATADPGIWPIRRACYSLAASTDGHYIAVGYAFGQIGIFDQASGNEVRTLLLHHQGVLSLAFSAENKTLFSGGFDGCLGVWDTETWEILRKDNFQPFAIRSIAVSPAAAQPVEYATALDNGVLVIWKGAENRQGIQASLKGLRSVCYSPKGELLASGDEDHKIRLWNSKSGKLMQELEGHGSWVNSICFHPDGVRLATGSSDHDVRIWSTAGECKKRFQGHDKTVSSVCFSDDGDILFSASWDGTVREWPIDLSYARAIYRGHESSVYALCLNSFLGEVISGGNDCNLRLWSEESIPIAYQAECITENRRIYKVPPDARSATSSQKNILHAPLNLLFQAIRSKSAGMPVLDQTIKVIIDKQGWKAIFHQKPVSKAPLNLPGAASSSDPRLQTRGVPLA